MFKPLLFFAFVAAAAAQKDPDVKLLETTTQLFESFPEMDKMGQYYDEDSKLEMHSAYLPFAGEFEGEEEIKDFYQKVADSITFDRRQYEIKYLDGRTGNVGVLLRFMDGRFRGRALDEQTKFFLGDEVVDTFHFLTFGPDGKIIKHEIKVNNMADVFEHAAPKSLKNLRKLNEAFYGEETLGPNSSVMDLISDDVEVLIHSDHPLFGNESEYKGKDGVMDLFSKLQAADTLGKEEAKENGDDTSKKPDKFKITPLFADDDTVHQKICYERKTLPNGKVLKDFCQYETYEFDKNGNLNLMDVSFSRLFDPSELANRPKAAEGDEKKDTDKEKPKDKDKEKLKDDANATDTDTNATDTNATDTNATDTNATDTNATDTDGKPKPMARDAKPKPSPVEQAKLAAAAAAKAKDEAKAKEGAKLKDDANATDTDTNATDTNATDTNATAIDTNATATNATDTNATDTNATDTPKAATKAAPKAPAKAAPKKAAPKKL